MKDEKERLIEEKREKILNQLTKRDEITSKKLELNRSERESQYKSKRDKSKEVEKMIRENINAHFAKLEEQRQKLENELVEKSIFND